MQNIIKLLVPGILLFALIIVMYKIIHFIYLAITYDKGYAHAYMFDLKNRKFKYGETTIKKGDQLEVYVKENDVWISGTFLGISKQDYFKICSSDLSKSIYYFDLKQLDEFKFKLKKEQ